MSASPERRPTIDLEEFERRLRAPESTSGANDPLADLARLVAGQGSPGRDPFASIFADRAPSSRSSLHEIGAHDGEDAELPDLSQIMRRGFDERRDLDEVSTPRFEAPVRFDLPPRVGEAMEAPAVDAPEPDRFHASSEYENWAEEDSVPPDAQTPAAPRQRSRKPLYLTGAVLAAGMVMIGASLAWRGGGGTTPAGVSIIKAASGPTKVQPEGQASSDSGSQPSTMLDKSTPAPTVKKVVSRDEAPMDVAAAEKLPRVIPLGEQAPANPMIPAPPVRTSDPAPAQVFPEPKKVKTVAVRADGTIISSATAPAPARAAPPAAPAARTATPKSDTPKSDTRAAATTAAPTMAMASPTMPMTAAPKPAAAPPKAVQAKPPVAAKPAPKPKQVAAVEQDDTSDDNDAAPAKPAASAGGAFAVQLAAPGSEVEARQTATRLGERYSSQLRGRRPSVVKAADKAVWRVRVGGLSREAATSACEGIKSAGGACFVAR